MLLLGDPVVRSHLPTEEVSFTGITRLEPSVKRQPMQQINKTNQPTAKQGQTLASHPVGCGQWSM